MFYKEAKMNLPGNLRKTSDDCLISELKDLVKREREVLTQVLHYLKELEIRKLYLQRGFSSLFAYLTEELAYSEGAAQRRIQAMRLIKDLPEVEKKIESGELSLSVASQLQGFIQREDKKRSEQKTHKLNPIEKLELVQNLEGTSSRICEMKLAEISPETGIPKERTKILTHEKTLIQFTASQELMTKINRLKSLISHQNPEGRYDILFEKIIELALDKHDPARREKRRRQKQSSPQPGARKEPKELGGIQATAIPKAPSPSFETNTKSLPTPAMTRYVPKQLRDRIWNRDLGKCQHRDGKTGKQCKSSHLLQLDHKFPFTLGGEASEENLQLKCRAHNQYRSELLFEFDKEI